MLPSDLLSDLVTLYQQHKDVAGPAAGSLAYPAGKLLLWSGRKVAQCGLALTRWATAARPPVPLEEAVAVLIENVGRMEIAHRYDSGKVSLSNGTTRVDFDGTVHTSGVEVPYTAAEKKAILAAHKARAAELLAAERDRLREAAALGN